MANNTAYAIHIQFAQSLAIIHSIPEDEALQPTVAEKLHLYGLFKQATEGNVNTPRPSSKKVVDYAKWKAWSHMKDISPIEAQRLYVESLIQLITEFVSRYPHHERTAFLKKALNSLQYDQEEEDFFEDAYDSKDFESEGNFINTINQRQLHQEHYVHSPASSSSATLSSYQSPSLHKNVCVSTYYDQPNQSEYPTTPISLPSTHHTVTNQWILNQMDNKNVYVRPMDFLSQTDLISEADTVDQEVAKITSKLSLQSPTQHPYSPIHEQSSSSSSVESKRASPKPIKIRENRALERLQTEVSVLTEQLDRLRRGIKKNEERRRKWTTSGLLKLILKRAMANSLLLFIVGYILWQKKYPATIHSIMFNIIPFLQRLLHASLRKVVFWKVHV
ncbi:acyl CoA binding protein-domain-containing protein [Pilobolus umbonatus]|nr:acyl CoA binding protein-domain-containing protein [Pilobolus umbonatus]